MKLTIQKKIVLSLTSLTLIPLVLICIYLGINIYSTTLNSFRDASTREIKQIETAFEFFFNDLKENISFLAQTPVIKDSKGKMTSYLNTDRPRKIDPSEAGEEAVEIEKFLQRFLNTHNAYVEIYAGSEKGEMILASQDDLPAGYDPRQRPWYTDALQSKDPVVTDPYLSTNGDITITIARAFTKNGSLQGVAGIDVSLKVLTSIIENIKIGKSGFMMLAKDDGTVLANPRHKDTIFKNLKNITKPGYKDLLSKNTKVTLDKKDYFSIYYTSNDLGWEFIGLIPQEEVTSGVNSFLISMAAIASVFFLIAGAIGVILAKKITKPISETTEILSEIAEGEGDLTKRIKIQSNDEIGEMGKYFNMFLENLTTMVREISDNSKTLKESSQDFTGLSDSLASQSKDASEKSNAVASAAEQTAASMNSIVSTIEQASTNLSMVASASEEMSSTIKEIAQNSEKARSISEDAVTQSENALKKMENLDESAVNIGKVTEVISDISDQTSLLALNATIEAARAGESGKGFAVVASEIKELATQTASSTQDIRNRINEIQENAKESVNAINLINKIISDINDINSSIATAIEEQNSATDEISDNINQASQGVEDVNKNTAETNSVIESISEDISQVNTSLNEVSSSSVNVKENSRKLNEMADTLNKLMSRFKY
ncbi:MAG: methyl-accepting chemotaxis protein [Thermodesulfobacteriota bacterium]